MRSIITFFYLLITLGCFSQVIEFGKDGTFSNNWHEGFLVLNDGTEMEGLIKFESAISKMYGMKMIGKIRFKANDDSKKKKYKKKAIDYFIIVNNNGDPEKYSYERVSKRHHLLLRVLAEGKMSLYSEDVINTIPGFSGGYPATRMYVKMEGEEIVDYENFSQIFKSFKTISENYFSECPKLMTKIKNDIYKPKDIISVVEEYNACQK